MSPVFAFRVRLCENIRRLIYIFDGKRKHEANKLMRFEYEIFDSPSASECYEAADEQDLQVIYYAKALHTKSRASRAVIGAYEVRHTKIGMCSFNNKNNNYFLAIFSIFLKFFEKSFYSGLEWFLYIFACVTCQVSARRTN